MNIISKFKGRKEEDYLIIFCATIGISVLCYLMESTIGYHTVGLIFLLEIAVLSLFVDKIPLFITAVLNFFILNYFFIPPVFTLHISRIADIFNLFANLIIALVSVIYIDKIKKNQISLNQSQEKLQLMYSFLNELNSANSIKTVVFRTKNALQFLRATEIVVYLREKKNHHKLAHRIFGDEVLHNDNNFKAAVWAFEKNQYVTPGVGIWSDSPVYVLPLVTPHGRYGVISLKFSSDEGLSREMFDLIKAFINQVALALEREINIDLAKESEIYTESQRLFETVLNNVSHELRTPISIITSAISNLNEPKNFEDKEKVSQLTTELNIASKRMNHLVDNILGMSRIESGLLEFKPQNYDIADLFGIVMNELGTETKNHQINIDIQDNLPLVKIDINWLKQSVINIIRNSLQYTPANGKIALSAKLTENDFIEIVISDEGPGVSLDYLPRLFEKFYKAPGSRKSGCGLGLAIAKAIVDLHNGYITAGNKDDNGLVITIKLQAVPESNE